MSTPLPLHVRLERAWSDFLSTPIVGDAAREEARAAIVAGVGTRERDEDGVRLDRTSPTPPAEAKALLMIAGEDVGRVRAYTPIRSFRLKFSLRANGKTDAGTADALNALYGALEYLLDATNLKEALTSTSRGIAVMKATRQPGVGHQVSGEMKTEFYVLELACVGLEHVEE